MTDLDARLTTTATFTCTRFWPRLPFLHLAIMDRSEGDAGATTDANPGNYAFHNHSTSTMPNNLPPKADERPLARQKRKRTRYMKRIAAGICDGL